jgi:hypothetical protein
MPSATLSVNILNSAVIRDILLSVAIRCTMQGLRPYRWRRGGPWRASSASSGLGLAGCWRAQRGAGRASDACCERPARWRSCGVGRASVCPATPCSWLSPCEGVWCTLCLEEAQQHLRSMYKDMPRCVLQPISGQPLTVTVTVTRANSSEQSATSDKRTWLK